jgi:membrane protease YdiL (CAAX protease family)
MPSKASTEGKPTRAARPGKPGRLRSRGNLLTSIVLVFPALLIYELGLFALRLHQRNGVDLITDEIGARIGYANFGILLVVVFFVLYLWLRRSQRFEWSALIPVLLESGVYALTMGTFIIFVMVDVLHMSPKLLVAASQPQGAAQKIVLALGAGVHEELFFRLILLGGMVAVGEKLVGRKTAIVASFLLSSAIFSAVHHLNPADPFRIGEFTYRTLAGLIFALLYWFRGFAVAVYTHALYDIYVMLLR